MRYAIFYGKDDATQAKEFGTELRERKHKTLVVDSAVVREADIEGDLDGLIFADNVDKHTRKGRGPFMRRLILSLRGFNEAEDKKTSQTKKSHDSPSGDGAPGSRS
jgi:hypothetical protein